MKYYSKISKGLFLLIFLLLIILFILFINEKNGWIGIVIILPIIVYIIDIFLNTFYIIENNELKVKCGFFYNKKIKIETIKKISKTNNIVNAPALSLKRIEVQFEKNKSIILSPKHEDDIIKNIIKINPNIQLKLS